MPQRPEQPTGYLGITRRPTRREWRRALLLFAVGMVGLVLVVSFIHPQASLLPVGSSAPPIQLQAVGGGAVAVPAAAAGHPYIVEFFEAGCAHCQQVAAQLCAEKVPVFAVDAAKDSAQTVSSYHNQYAPHCTYALLLDPDLVAGSAYHVNAVPTVYVVKDGKVLYAGTGLDGVSGLGAAVQKALGA
jgi:thiol-disulfide isomerase/thioredoxin